MFIYEIKNITNEKRYIGQSQPSNNRRLNNHRSQLNNNNHINPHLQSSWNKYGKDCFEWNRIVDDISTLDELNRLEIYWSKKYKTMDPKYGYNLAPCGGGSPMRGRKHSQKTKNLMSIQRRGKPKSKECKRKIRKSNKETWKNMTQDKQFMDKHRERSGNAWRGKTLSKEHVENMRKAGHLVWDSRSEEYKEEHRLRMAGSNNPCAKITEAIVKEIRQRYKEENCTQLKLAKEFNLTPDHICDIVNYRTWKHIKDIK